MQQYQAIFMKLVPKLQEIYGKSLETVVLYGSVARADDTPESDIDIAVIVHGYTKEMHDEMLDFLVNLELEFGKVISVLLIDYDHYQGWKDVIPFYKNVRKEGITLWQAA